MEGKNVATISGRREPIKINGSFTLKPKAPERPGENKERMQLFIMRDGKKIPVTASPSPNAPNSALRIPLKRKSPELEEPAAAVGHGAVAEIKNLQPLNLKSLLSAKYESNEASSSTPPPVMVLAKKIASNVMSLKKLQEAKLQASEEARPYAGRVLLEPKKESSPTTSQSKSTAVKSPAKRGRPATVPLDEHGKPTWMANRRRPYRYNKKPQKFADGCSNDEEDEELPPKKQPKPMIKKPEKCFDAHCKADEYMPQLMKQVKLVHNKLEACDRLLESMKSRYDGTMRDQSRKLLDARAEIARLNKLLEEKAVKREPPSP